MSDELIVNLKVIGMVDKHQKLVTKDTYLNLEQMSLVPECIRRWRRGDTRHTAIHKIVQTIDAALALERTEPMCKYLQQCVKGINNLKDTYSDCPQTCARLDAINDRILSVLHLKNVSRDSGDAVGAGEAAGDVKHGSMDSDPA
jgi:hypothetical protein